MRVGGKLSCEWVVDCKIERYFIESSRNSGRFPDAFREVFNGVMIDKIVVFVDFFVIIIEEQF